jgi:2-keto-4-pentenoate hydratase
MSSSREVLLLNTIYDMSFTILWDWETTLKRLTEDQVRSAAGMLVALRDGRLVLAGLPAEVTPGNTRDVQRIINAVSERIDRPVRGWKSYTLYKPMNPPFFAPIYDRFPSGAVIPAGISPPRLIEPEIMFQVDHAMPARDRRYDVAEVMESVTAVVGFEVIGSRFRSGSSSDGDAGTSAQGSLYGSLSDHISNGCIVVGDAIPGWRDVAFEDVSLRLTDGDRELISVVGCHPFDDPFLPVVVGVNRLRRHLGVRAGDIIVTSSSTSFFPVEPASRIRAVYEGLGEVTATFELP